MSDARDRARGQTSRSRTQRTVSRSSTQNRHTGQSGGQSGGPPGRGDTGPSQAAIESARRANEASAARRAAEPVRETWRDDPEKVDVWDPSQDIIDRQEKARLDALAKMEKKMARAQSAQKLGAALTASGITKEQFERMQAKGTLPPEVAEQLGLAKQEEGLWYDTKTGDRRKE